MRKGKFVCGMLALCLCLSVAGCGKNSEEKQAANYYQQELGLDKDEAEELAHELYGRDEDDDEEEPSVSEEAPQEILIEPLPELVNSEWYERKVQILDMVFDNFMDTTEENIRSIVAGSAYDVELPEDFDSNGDVCIRNLIFDGVNVAKFWKGNRSSTALMSEITDFVKYGLLNEGNYYSIAYGSVYDESIWFDKASIEFGDLKTRDDVLAYLAENGFVETEETIYEKGFEGSYNKNIFPDATSFEYADVPHYLCKGAQSITLYRMHKLSETDQEIEGNYHHYSGAHLNLVNRVTFKFNTDGTIMSTEPADYYTYQRYNWGVYIPGWYSLNGNTNLFMIVGEQID